MALQDLGNCVVVSPLHSPTVFSADRNGASVDTAKYAYACLVINIGVIVPGESVEFYLEHSTRVGGAYTTVRQVGLTASGGYNNATANVLPANNNTVQTMAIDLNNTRQFLRLRADHSASGGHLYSASLIMMPYVTNTVSDDAAASSAPLFDV